MKDFLPVNSLSANSLPLDKADPANPAKPLGANSPRLGSGMLLPWPRCCPWLLILVGVALGFVLGFSPWLFLLIGVFCLLSGMIGKA
jgi:hypothetical protein